MCIVDADSSDLFSHSRVRAGQGQSEARGEGAINNVVTKLLLATLMWAHLNHLLRLYEVIRTPKNKNSYSLEVSF